MWSNVSVSRLLLEAEVYTPPSMDQARQAVVEAGMPEEIALDLTDQEIVLFAQAETIQVRALGFGYDAREPLEKPDMRSWLLFAQLSEDQVVGLSYFTMEDTVANWQSGYRLRLPPFLTVEEFEGGLLYTEDGVPYEAPFPRLTSASLREDAWQTSVYHFEYAYVGESIYGAFNLPPKAEDRRGYVLFTAKMDLPQEQTFDLRTSFSFFAPWENLDHKSPEYWVANKKGRYEEHPTRFTLAGQVTALETFELEPR